MNASASSDPLREDDLREFIELSLNLVCIAGNDGFFKHVNPAWERVFGYIKEELLSQPYLDFVHPDDRNATAAEAAQVGSGRSAISLKTAAVVLGSEVLGVLEFFSHQIQQPDRRLLEMMSAIGSQIG